MQDSSTQTAADYITGKALEWLAAGYSPVPIGMAEKHPCIRWKAYQTSTPGEAEIRAWFGNGSGAGLGLVTGYGDVEMLELEGEAVRDGTLAEFLAELDARGLMPLWERIMAGYSETSPSGGIHVCVRVTDGEVPHNTPLARRPETQAELDGREMTKVEARKGIKKARPVVQIETRGTGGFTVLAPTAKRDGRAWRLLSGGPRSLAEVTTAELTALHDAARACDTYTAWKAAQAPAAAAPKPGKAGSSVPGAAGQAQASGSALAFAPWPDIMEPAGWVYVQDDDQGRGLWRRPGKDTGWSASTSDTGGLWVFSSSTDFDTEVAYSKAAVIAVLYDDMDAAEALERYGTPQQAASAEQEAVRASLGMPGAGKAEQIAAEGHDVSVVSADGVQDLSPSPDRPFLDDAAAVAWAKKQVPGSFHGGRDIGLLTARLAAAVATMGPLAGGADDRMWRYAHGVYLPAPRIVRERASLLLRDLYRRSYAANAEDILLAACPAITSEPVEQYLNVTNGLLDWRTGILYKHTPEVRSTVQLGVPWDPAALCPVFDWWLPQVVPADCVELVWELIGYLAYSGNPLHAAVMLVGSGRNGKGTLLRVILAILGKANVTSASLADLVGTRFTTASLFGKIANIAGDIDGTYLESTAVLKAVTGMDQISAEHKGRDRFDFTPWAVPVFSANKIPASADTTAGYLSRWLVIPFPNSFAGREDRTIEARLHAELPGILAAGVRRLKPLLDRGQFALAGSASAREAKADFERRVDQVRTWLAECCTVWPTGVHDPVVSRTPLYAAYKRWVFRDGGKALGAGEFYQRLAATGVMPGVRDGVRGFKGIKVVDECQFAASDYR